MRVNWADLLPSGRRWKTPFLELLQESLALVELWQSEGAAAGDEDAKFDGDYDIKQFSREDLQRLLLGQAIMEGMTMQQALEKVREAMSPDFKRRC